MIVLVHRAGLPWLSTPDLQREAWTSLQLKTGEMWENQRNVEKEQQTDKWLDPNSEIIT